MRAPSIQPRHLCSPDSSALRSQWEPAAVSPAETEIVPEYDSMDKLVSAPDAHASHGTERHPDALLTCLELRRW